MSPPFGSGHDCPCEELEMTLPIRDREPDSVNICGFPPATGQRRMLET